MLIPRFSVRWLFALIAICAVLAFIVSLATAGRLWAVALSIAAGSLVLTLALHASAFGIAWGLAELWRLASGRKVTTSPFAPHTAPPQLVSVPDPD